MSWLQWFRNLIVRGRTHGQGLVEYSLILVLVAIVVIGILSQVGGQTSYVYSRVSCTLGGGAAATSDHPGNPQGNGTGIENNTTATDGC